MTILGWVLFVGGAALIALFTVLFASAFYRPGRIACGVVGAILIIGLLVGMLWYFNNTAAGARMLKTQASDFNGGIDRIVTVYDVNGSQIKQYSGKFDIDYDDNRIIFDDENGKRHIIYYPTGTVIVDEK